MKFLKKREPCLLCNHHKPGRRMRDGICQDCIDSCSVPGMEEKRRFSSFRERDNSGLKLLGNTVWWVFVGLLCYGIISRTVQLVVS